ncbi:hypothetical protein [Actinomadura madurae]|uniref:hypothetical protein n=1 Tax=Actinomadura madurae TaxID=1993 RepID=UPI0020D230A6|nr:hypothetical protein [Actinomadura madurae]MCP9978458.1 hypothetical protein [Actinomadura madurae]
MTERVHTETVQPELFARLAGIGREKAAKPVPRRPSTTGTACSWCVSGTSS